MPSLLTVGGRRHCLFGSSLRPVCLLLTSICLLMTTIMMIIDLYCALRRAPLLRYVSGCIMKRNVVSAD